MQLSAKDYTFLSMALFCSIASANERLALQLTPAAVSKKEYFDERARLRAKFYEEGIFVIQHRWEQKEHWSTQDYREVFIRRVLSEAWVQKQEGNILFRGALDLDFWELPPSVALELVGELLTRPISLSNGNSIDFRASSFSFNWPESGVEAKQKLKEILNDLKVPEDSSYRWSIRISSAPADSQKLIYVGQCGLLLNPNKGNP